MANVGINPQAAPAMSRRDKVIREIAKRRVQALKGFYIHLTVFLLVNAGLLAVNLATGGAWWVQWVFLGWGIGIVAHGLAIFGRTPKLIDDWQERKIQQLVNGR